jgi:hypothetical protein
VSSARETAQYLLPRYAARWAVHFIDSDYRTRIGSWLLCDSHDDVLKIFHWGHIAAEDLAEHHRNILRPRGLVGTAGMAFGNARLAH